MSSWRGPLYCRRLPAWNPSGSTSAPRPSSRRRPCRKSRVGRTLVALTFKDGAFGAISGVCNHVGGPLGEGPPRRRLRRLPVARLQVPLPTGEGEPGFEDDRVPSHEVKVENGRVLVDASQRRKRAQAAARAPSARARRSSRAPGPRARRSASRPRPWTGEPALLDVRGCSLDAALAHAQRGARRRGEADPPRASSVPRLRGLLLEDRARLHLALLDHADGSEADQLDQVYEALVHWADVVLVATPIRWGAASSLYFKMAERMNCIQNQITTRDRVLIRNKVAAFIDHRRPGQRPGRRRADARLLRRARLPLPAVPLHRPLARLVRRGHGEERRGACSRARSCATAPRRSSSARSPCCLLLNGHAPPVAKTVRPGRKAQRLEVERKREE